MGNFEQAKISEIAQPIQNGLKKLLFRKIIT